MYNHLAVSCIWICWVLAVGVQSQVVDEFINPPPLGPDLYFSDNPVYALGETLNISFCQSFDPTYSIYLYQRSSLDVDPFEIIFPNLNQQGCVARLWSVSTTLDICQSNVFYLRAKDDSDNGINSHNFNLTGADDTLGVCPITATQASKKIVLSTEASIGIGVSSGLAVCLAICFTAFYVRTRRQRKQQMKVYDLGCPVFKHEMAADYAEPTRYKLKRELHGQWRVEQNYETKKQRRSMLQEHELDAQTSMLQKHELEAQTTPTTLKPS